MTFFQWIKNNEKALKKNMHLDWHADTKINYVIDNLHFNPFHKSVLQCEEFQNMFVYFVDKPVFTYYGRFYNVNSIFFKKDEDCKFYFENMKKTTEEIAWYGFQFNGDLSEVRLRLCNISNPNVTKNLERINIIDKMLESECLILQ